MWYLGHGVSCLAVAIETISESFIQALGGNGEQQLHFVAPVQCLCAFFSDGRPLRALSLCQVPFGRGGDLELRLTLNGDNVGLV